MKLSDLLAMGFLNLWRRKLRTILTILGMVIGTASIVVMISLGIGINQSFMESIEQAGSLTTIQVTSWKWTDNGNGGGTSTEVTLDKKAIETMKQIPNVTAVMPQVNAWGMVKCGQYVTDVSIMGVDVAVAEQFGIKLAEGRMPVAGSSTNIEIVLGSYALQNFYNPNTGKQAMDREGNTLIDMERGRFQLTFDMSNIYPQQEYFEGKPIMSDFAEGGGGGTVAKGKMYKITPVGIMSDTSNEFSWYTIMDINSLMKIAKQEPTFVQIDQNKFQQVYVKCTDINTVLEVKEQIEAMGYGTYSLQDALKAMQETTASLQMLLGAIGGVALLVAAIGIINTMMMSIYERTKEIGIIKVVGCPMSSIATMFLTEAAYIGLIGGAIGILLSIGLSLAINGLAVSAMGTTFRSVIPVWLGAGAVLFSMLVALISGVFPAFRAMNLSPLTALRNE